MVARLKEVDSCVRDKVHDAMLLGQSTRPRSRGEVPERFRFSDAGEWVAHDRFDEIECSQRDLPVGIDPVAKVFSKFWLEDGVPALLRHDLLLADAHTAPECFDRFWAAASALGTTQSAKQALSIRGRSKEMSGFHERPQLVGRNERNVFAASTVNENRLATVHDLIQKGLQVRTCLRVARFRRHTKPYSNTVRAIPALAQPVIFRTCRRNPKLPRNSGTDKIRQ